jgi:hypothetical protein
MSHQSTHAPPLLGRVTEGTGKVVEDSVTGEEVEPVLECVMELAPAW